MRVNCSEQREPGSKHRSSNRAEPPAGEAGSVPLGGRPQALPEQAFPGRKTPGWIPMGTPPRLKPLLQHTRSLRLALVLRLTASFARWCRAGAQRWEPSGPNSALPSRRACPRAASLGPADTGALGRKHPVVPRRFTNTFYRQSASLAARTAVASPPALQIHFPCRQLQALSSVYRKISASLRTATAELFCKSTKPTGHGPPQTRRSEGYVQSSKRTMTLHSFTEEKPTAVKHDTDPGR